MQVVEENTNLFNVLEERNTVSFFFFFFTTTRAKSFSLGQYWSGEVLEYLVLVGPPIHIQSLFP